MSTSSTTWTLICMGVRTGLSLRSVFGEKKKHSQTTGFWLCNKTKYFFAPMDQLFSGEKYIYIRVIMQCHYLHLYYLSVPNICMCSQIKTRIRSDPNHKTIFFFYKIRSLYAPKNTRKLWWKSDDEWRCQHGVWISSPYITPVDIWPPLQMCAGLCAVIIFVYICPRYLTTTAKGFCIPIPDLVHICCYHIRLHSLEHGCGKHTSISEVWQRS